MLQVDGDNSPVHTYAPGRLEAPNDSTDSNPESRHTSNELPRSQYEPQSPQQPRSSAIHEIVIANTGGPLGVHVVPHKDEASGYVCGVCVCCVVIGHVTDSPIIHHFVIPWTACYQVNDDTIIILSLLNISGNFDS